MDPLVSAFDTLPQPLRDPVALAIPFFILLLVIESVAARVLEHRENTDRPDDRERPRPGAYRGADARASISMGLVSIATMAVWKGLALLGYAALFAYVAPWQLPADQWYTWVIALVGVDVLFYFYHRTAHRVRLIWATHQAHHSSEYFNFSTALRQKWNNSGEIVMWLPLPLLGVPPWMVFFAFSISLVYQFWIHTERIGHLPRPFEFVFNTPSHHRVHHGRDQDYLDKNYGGILIIWDRIFGSFQKELQRPTYGLTKPVDTFNIWRLETREYVAIAADVRRTRSVKDKIGYILGPPGWQPRRRGTGVDVGTASASST
ncbi:sterol desaturase family protein [Williamsia sp. 1135]|uniref:sterol desaturase family protein n=1 Tax=Williamsia sp. 1135 TaxID=1889262 RepID=UPI000A10BCFF|nr:sterol desaturase family protein [Williamsia sp. 1135]ORM31911.1 C-5 sterol desaturase [Williamsia sp. 1135]